MHFTDFLVCPESSCTEPSIELDYYISGDAAILTFNCTNCLSSSAEDDMQWYVECPHCQLKKHERDVQIEYNLDESGLLTFICPTCGTEGSGKINTKWNAK